MEQKVIIESLAMDLKRVALGLHRGSVAMADRFKVEAFARSEQLERRDHYLNKLIDGMRNSLALDNGRMAEDALMYSTLFQNFAVKNFN